MITDASAVRWTNAALLVYIGDALDELWWKRRSAFNLTSIPTTMPTKPAAVGDTVFVQDSYRKPLGHFLAWACFLEDAEDSGNAKLAQTHWDFFEKGLG